MKTHLSCHELPKSLWKRYSSNNENHNSWIHKTAVIKNNKQYSSLIIIEYNGKKERWLRLLGLIKKGKHMHNFLVDSPGTKIAYLNSSAQSNALIQCKTACEEISVR